ncbi:MAG: carboxypeptidase regulatory-like domain-containing protein, partial [Edaphobacter sp.]
MIQRILFLAVLSCVLCGNMFAQSTTASLLGIVRDPSGALISTAEITATNTQTGLARSLQSDAGGAYLFTNLPIGQYQLRVVAPGFQTFLQTGITLVVEQNARVDVALTVGEISQTVQVDAQSTGVDTHSATIGQLVDRERIQELPLNGRNAMALAALVPGVTNVLAAPPVQTQSRSGPSVTVAGGRDTQNEFRFDGTSWKNITQNTGLNLPSPDALQEFQIITSSSSAEYGRNSGGVFISVTRSGTNQFHGSVWEYLRNTALNARNYFATTKPDLKQNQFGLTIGGPAIRNKLFFFGSYQGTRIRQSQLLATALPPTAAQRNGVFSGSLRDPIHGGSYAGGVIPSTDFDPVAINLLNAYVPTSNATGGRLVQLVPNPTNDNQYLARMDYTVSAHNNMFVRYFREGGSIRTQAGNVSPYDPDITGLTAENWAAQDTQTFGANLLNEFRLGVGRVHSTVRQLDNTQLSDLGAVFPGVITPQLPNVSVSGFFSLATTDLFVEHDNIYQVGDTLRWNRGKHSISIGGEIERLELYNFGSSGNNGSFAFDGSQTGNAFADFLIGRPVTMKQASPYQRNAKTWDGYIFAQDDIRLTSRLTANVGVRYEIFQPFGITGNRTNTYREGQQSLVTPGAPLGMVFPGDKGIDSGLVPTDYNNIAPRIGLAFDPRGDGRTSIRAAYGLYFEDMRSDIWTYPAVNQPFVISNTVNTPSSLKDPYAGHINPFPYVYTPQSAKFTFPMSLFTFPAPTLNAPYVHNLSFSFQRELPTGLILQLGYVGKLERNLIRMVQKNPAIYTGSGSTLGNTDARRTIMPGTYSSLRQLCTCSDATYNSMQASLTRRYKDGLTFMLSYTWGKLLDYYSATNLGQTPQDPYNEAADRGRSDYDRRHVFNGSVVYSIPFFKNADRPLRAVFGGWSASSIVSLATGNPVFIVSGRDFSLTGVNFDRPNLVG